MGGLVQRFAVPVVSMLLGAAIVGGVAYATIPDANGVIHGCYQRTDTAAKPLRVLTGQTVVCPAGWRALEWNAKGQAGPPGPPGSSIVLHSVATPQSISPGNTATLALSPASWTQPAGALNEIVGSVTIREPTDCDQRPILFLTVKVDGTTIGETDAQTGTVGAVHTYQLLMGPIQQTAESTMGDNTIGILMPPATDAPHTLTLTAENNCGGAGDFYGVTAASIDVIGTQ
jgi:hypothetical protein